MSNPNNLTRIKAHELRVGDQIPYYAPRTADLMRTETVTSINPCGPMRKGPDGVPYLVEKHRFEVRLSTPDPEDAKDWFEHDEELMVLR